MAKLVHRYVWVATVTVIVSGVSLLMWFHDEIHHQHRWKTDDSFNLNSAKNPRLLMLPKANKSDLEGNNSDHVENTRTNNKTPKVYIYSLPPKFNSEIQECLSGDLGQTCFHLENYGFGNLLYEEGDMGVYNTNMFSLEIVIHQQLNHSMYRTQHPEEADVFYIPAYMGSMFFCDTRRGSLVTVQKEMFAIIKSMPYFDAGRPHISTLAKIEREMSSKGYPLLQNPNCRNVTYITIEEEARTGTKRLLGILDQRLILAPYPAYVHRNNSRTMSKSISAPTLQSRNVFVFLAASTRRSNLFRNSILDQFKNKVNGKNYGEYLNLLRKYNTTELPEQVMLVTHECYHNHLNITIGWMQNSVFCLQPHGDSPTRKSFYDSIQSGCIPVIFKFKFEDVKYPFEKVLNYTDFTVSIDALRIQRQNERVFNILKEIPLTEINRLHNNVLTVARQLQYSIPDVTKPKKYVDAIDMIMDQVKEIYHL